jgi:hypothetical protein
VQAAVLDDWDSAWAEDAIATIIGLSLSLSSFSSDDLRQVWRRKVKGVEAA